MEINVNDFSIIFVSFIIVLSCSRSICQSRYIDTRGMRDDDTDGKTVAALPYAENIETSSTHAVSADEVTVSGTGTERLSAAVNHEFDSVCRTIYEEDKDALLKIQGATDGILKVIDRMDIEARPSRPVSAFIGIPKDIAVDQNGNPTQDVQKAIKDQVINKEGFTLSYDDKLSLEVIKVAAEEIKTQLLHLDLEERPTKPKSVVSGNQNQVAVNPEANMRNARSLTQKTGGYGRYGPTDSLATQTSISQILDSEVASSLNNGNQEACTESTKQMKSIQNILKELHNEIDHVGRTMKEEYADNTNLERTDIKSTSDNLKKLQGMIAETNHTFIKGLRKIFIEQSEAHDRFQKELDTIENIIMKLFLGLDDKKLGETMVLNGTKRIPKSIKDVGSTESDGHQNKDDYDADNAVDENDYYSDN